MRKTAVVTTAIWSDGDFLALTASAQRIYLLALSQPSLSWAGVVAYTPRRWARFASGDTPTKVKRSVAELRDATFVLVDEATEELLVRSLIRHDRAMRSPNMAKAVIRDVGVIQSPMLRRAVVGELQRHFDETCDDPSFETGWRFAADLLAEPIGEPLPEPFTKGVA